MTLEEIQKIDDDSPGWSERSELQKKASNYLFAYWSYVSDKKFFEKRLPFAVERLKEKDPVILIEDFPSFEDFDRHYSFKGMAWTENFVYFTELWDGVQVGVLGVPRNPNKEFLVGEVGYHRDLYLPEKKFLIEQSKLNKA